MILKEEQRYGRNKESIVNHAYIQSGNYRKKFDKLTENKNINKLLYQKAKEMLLHRSGTLLEDMYWVDMESGEIIASVVDSKDKQKIIYPDHVNMAFYLKKGYNEEEAQLEALRKIQINYNMDFEEVR